MKSDLQIAIPAEERGWEIWHWTRRGARLRKTVAMLDELPSGGKDTLVGVPAQESTSIGLSLPSADPSLFDDMVFSQLDMRGLTPGGPGHTVFSYHVIERLPGESLISADVLPPDFNEDFCLPRAEAYTAAARLFPIPDHTVAILREHDQLVLIAGQHGRMVFSQILNAGTEFNAALVQEINLTILSLQGAGQLPERVSLEIWTAVSEPEIELLERRFDFEVKTGARPDPDASLVKEASGPMLPHPVRTAIHRRHRAQRIRTGLLAVAAIYIVIAVAVTFYSRALKQRAEHLENVIAENRPEVRFVQEAAARNRALEPAIEKRFYPLRQLNEITRLMPPSGILIEKFSTKGSEIRLEGKARDAQLAIQFMEDVKNHPGLPGYTWSNPQPRVSDNNTASFETQGQYAGAQQ